jgi:hypothetical protein
MKTGASRGVAATQWYHRSCARARVCVHVRVRARVRVRMRVSVCACVDAGEHVCIVTTCARPTTPPRVSRSRPPPKIGAAHALHGAATPTPPAQARRNPSAGGRRDARHTRMQVSGGCSGVVGREQTRVQSVCCAARHTTRPAPGRACRMHQTHLTRRTHVPARASGAPADASCAAVCARARMCVLCVCVCVSEWAGRLRGSVCGHRGICGAGVAAGDAESSARTRRAGTERTSAGEQRRT